MAVYELYLGGPRQQNTDWAIFPAATFSASNAAVLPPADKVPVVFGASRTLDFTNDVAVRYFYKTTRNSTFTNGDSLGVVVVPAPSMFLGLFYNINRAVAGTGGALAIKFRTTGQVMVSGIDPSVAGGSFVPYNGAGVITTLDTVTATLAKFNHFFATPDIVDLVLTTLPSPASLSALSITITPVYYSFQTTNMN